MTQALRSATVFSLAAEPPRVSPLSADSQASFDAATLLVADAAHPCTLRKLTTLGATLSLVLEQHEQGAARLQLANGQLFEGRVDWCSDGEAGFLFDAPVDVIGTLARTLASLPADRRSMPRVEINQTIFIRSGDKVELARTRNVSQGGVGVDTRLELGIGTPVQVTLDTLRPIDGTVRWCRQGQAGIEFREELGWQTLMPWLRHVQRVQAGAIRTPAAIEADGMIPDKHAIRLDAPARVREGARWWNARLRGLTARLVELETGATFRPGVQLWVSLPQIGGGPAAVIEAAHNRILCEFRLPLQPRELGQYGTIPLRTG